MKKVARFILNLFPCKIDWPHWLLRRATMRNYKKYHGYSFDLDNPQLFTEKVLWYQTEFDRCDEVSKITDKILFKDYIKEHLGDGWTIPMYGCWDNIDDFARDWDKLPNSFVLRSNIQGSGACIRVIADKSAYRLENVKKDIVRWLDPRNTLLNNYVCRMYDSKPMILAEEFVEGLDDQMCDCKFFCFDGVPQVIYVYKSILGQAHEKAISFYDLEWNKLDATIGDHVTAEFKRPKHLEDMKEISMKLAKGFPFVRVDFFEADDKLLMAEMTFCPNGACLPYNPKSFNKKLGDLFVLPKSR